MINLKVKLVLRPHVTKPVMTKSQNPSKSPELLAAYCHMLLKKSNKNLEEAELEEALNQMLTVFRYIEDKDVFEVFYKKKLAERLVLNSFIYAIAFISFRSIGSVCLI